MHLNVNDARSINQQLFEQMARFECEASAATCSNAPCGKPAMKVIGWRQQDGDIVHRALCDQHAVEQQRFWSEMNWDTCVVVSDIEDWKTRYLLRRADRDSCWKQI